MTENTNSFSSPEQPCVTRFELAALLHVSVRTVDRIIAAGEIPVRRVRGYAVRFMRSDVEEYLNRNNLPTAREGAGRGMDQGKPK